MLKYDAVIDHILGKFEQYILSDFQVQAFLQRVQQDRSFHKQIFVQKQSIIFVYEHNLPSPYLLCMSMNFRYFMHYVHLVLQYRPLNKILSHSKKALVNFYLCRRTLNFLCNGRRIVQWQGYWVAPSSGGSIQRQLVKMKKIRCYFFKKMGQPRPLFHFFIFVFSKTYYNFYSK